MANQKNRQNQKSQRNPNSSILPLWIREKGIATRIELVASLTPYMKWRARTEIRAAFEKFLPETKAKDCRNVNGAFDGAILSLSKKGLVEVVHGEFAPCRVKNLKPPRYAYYRRVVQSIPKNSTRQRMLDGTYGLKAEKVRARKEMNGTRQLSPLSSAKITMDDVGYIRSNPHNTSNRAMAEMFQINVRMVAQIRNGYLPAHLREKRARSPSANTLAETLHTSFQ